MDNDVDIVVTGRHTQITDRFRTHLEEKLSKVPHLLPRVSRIDVVVTHEKAVRNCDAVEITCYAKGPVIRAEACTDDRLLFAGHRTGQALRAAPSRL